MESVFYGFETLKINIMTSERIKEIQQETAYPNSVSVQQALLTVWNECEQERVKNCSIPAVMRIPIELHFAGDYRLEYDGKKEILAYWVRHTEEKRHYFKWDWSMIWILVKYRLVWGMKISFTCTKACDREEYLVQFFAE